ncbi:MAG: response regulator receiver protein [Bacteroidota bacterium]
MKKIEILVFGKHPAILETLLRLINANPNWQAEGTMKAEEVIEKSQLNAYDLLLLGGGIAQSEENKVRAILGQLRPKLKIIQHFGGGSGLLSNEIQTALSDHPMTNFNVLDNPFE